MRTYNLLAIILLGVAATSCGDDDKAKKTLFTIDTSAMKQHYKPQETLSLLVTNAKNKEIDSVAYYINEKRAGSAKGNTGVDFTFTNQKFDTYEIKAIVYYDGDSAEATGRVDLVSPIQPQLMDYEVVNTYPHDTQAYTQGLEFYRDTLFEGTGQYRRSSLRKVNHKTGEVYKQVNLEDRFFGEGITILNNKVYQLTWKENTGYIYDADTFKKIREFQYFKNIEGWGLTNDGQYLYQSDGTEKIWVLDPETLKQVDYINVYTANSKITAVNEMEWIDGKIYGNIYQKDAIAVIDPKTGAVEGVINLSDLKKQVTPHPQLDVLNGIAYNPKTKTIFVTGKNWDKMFEIRVK